MRDLPSVKNRLARLPVIRDLANARRASAWQRETGVVMKHRPGHYGSPIPALTDVRARDAEIFSCPESLPGVDLRVDEQLALAREFAPFCREQPFGLEPREGLRYHLDNSWFTHSDGIALFCMLRWARPRRLIEVGSGFSSALVLDTCDRFLGDELECTFIEPYPERRLHKLLSESDKQKHRIIPQPVQSVSLETFDVLEDGDFLFIDSSHVSKVGSDVNRLVFDVLPRLRPGVFVHFHDILWPFEYSRDWVYGGRAFNEAYLLHAFLMFQSQFDIVWFNNFLIAHHQEAVAEQLPAWATVPRGASLWLRRVQGGV